MPPSSWNGNAAMDQKVTWELLVMICGALGTAVYLTWFIAAQFAQNRKVFYKMMSLHNKEDDDRFENLKDDMWSIKLRNASRDGEAPPERKSFPRRRYLQEAEAEFAGDSGG